MSIIVVPGQFEGMPSAPPCHIADGIMPKQSLVGVAAQAGAGKSFTLLDMALTMAVQRSWFGHATESTGVLYVCGEGFPGIPGRVLAWCTEHGVASASLDKRIGFCRVPFDISDEAMRLRVMQALEELGITADVIILDTLSANAPPGFNENGTEHMKAMMDAARHLRDSLPCTVVLVHHMGHDTTRERGNTDFRGALDVMLFLKVEGDHRVLSVSKSRDFMPMAPMRFVLSPCHGSAVLTLADTTTRGGTGPTPSQRALLLRLDEISHGAPVKAADWQRVSGYGPSQFYNLRSELDAACYVLKTPAGYLLTQSGSAVIAPAPVDAAESLRHSDITPIAPKRSRATTTVAPLSIDREHRSGVADKSKHSDRSAIGLRSEYGPALDGAPFPKFEHEGVL